MSFLCFSGSQSDIDVCGYLTELMSFLQRHGTLVSPDAHSCSWVSVVFAEQDDDMMESAKTLIGLYLYQKRFGIGFIHPVIMELYKNLYFSQLIWVILGPVLISIGIYSIAEIKCTLIFFK